MSNSDQNKPGGKSGKRKQKRSQKPDQAQTPMPDQQQAAKELIDAAILLPTPRRPTKSRQRIRLRSTSSPRRRKRLRLPRSRQRTRRRSALRRRRTRRRLRPTRRRSAFRRLRPPIATAPENRLRMPGPMSKNSPARARSTRPWRFRPNSPNRLTTPSLRIRGRFAGSTASCSSRC